MLIKALTAMAPKVAVNSSGESYFDAGWYFLFLLFTYEITYI